MKRIKNQRGFTLVDMLMVMALISILANIAVPKYDRLRAGAIAVQAKVALAEIYKVEKIHFYLTNYYSPCLRQLGYEPSNNEVSRYFAIGFDANSIFPCESGRCAVYGENAGSCKAVNSSYGDSVLTSDINYSANNSAYPDVAPTDFKNNGRLLTSDGHNYFSSIGRYKDGRQFFFVGAVGTSSPRLAERIPFFKSTNINDTPVYDAWTLSSDHKMMRFKGAQSKKFSQISETTL